jgi:hypothetical protein
MRAIPNIFEETRKQAIAIHQLEKGASLIEQDDLQVAALDLLVAVDSRTLRLAHVCWGNLLANTLGASRAMSERW